MDPELTCCNSSTGKNEGMGELKDGMVFDISLSMARRLLLPRQKEDGGLILLEALAEQISFEVAIGRNGKVWVKGAGVRAIMAIGKALQDTDQEVLNVQEQERLVRKLLREV